MQTLSDILRRVGDTAYFTGIDVKDANAPGYYKYLPLHVAAIWGDCEAIEILVRSGAYVNQRGEHGFTPLMEAVAQGHEAATSLLVSLGAHPIPNDDGESPSDYAAISGSAELAEWLRSRGF